MHAAVLVLAEQEFRLSQTPCHCAIYSRLLCLKRGLTVRSFLLVQLITVLLHVFQLLEHVIALTVNLWNLESSRKSLDDKLSRSG